MKYLSLVLLLSLLLVKCQCSGEPKGYDFKVGFQPHNLDQINSKYDDYNSDYPFPGESSGPFIYSSNYKSSGGNFDIEGSLMEIFYYGEKDYFYGVYNKSPNGTAYDQEVEMRLFLRNINSNFDELGPYRYPKEENNNNRYLLFASNKEGQFDIYYLPFTYYYNSIGTVGSLNSINSSSDDLYPSIYQSEQKLMFCSDRENNQFDIYESSFTTQMFDSTWQGSSDIHKLSVLNSSKDDKCPFVIDPKFNESRPVMVFTSNREGGFGGFDLYYSIFENDKWSSPINFGQNINSSDDEYRPILIDYLGSDNFVMIFSSNRPGGVGGFDLYAVRVKF